MELAVTYRFDPASALDGATVHIPLAALNQVDEVGFDWGVPGFRTDLVDALVRSLPKEHRRELTPMNEVTAEVIGRRIGRPRRGRTAPRSPPRWRPWCRKSPARCPPTASTPSGSRPTCACRSPSTTKAAGRHGFGKDLAALQAELTPRVRAAIARAMPIEERTGITSWDFGDLPREV